MARGIGKPIVRMSFRCWIHDDLSLTWIDNGERDKMIPNIESAPKF